MGIIGINFLASVKHKGMNGVGGGLAIHPFVRKQASYQNGVGIAKLQDYDTMRGLNKKQILWQKSVQHVTKVRL
jgi:hypothetical protein